MYVLNNYATHSVETNACFNPSPSLWLQCSKKQQAFSYNSIQRIFLHTKLCISCLTLDRHLYSLSTAYTGFVYTMLSIFLSPIKALIYKCSFRIPDHKPFQSLEGISLHTKPCISCFKQSFWIIISIKHYTVHVRLTGTVMFILLYPIKIEKLPFLCGFFPEY